MGKFIGFGEINYNLKYILILILCINITTFLYGFNYYGTFREIKIFSKWENEKFSSHFYIHQVFNYLGVVLFSIIFYSIEQCNIKSELINPTSELSYKVQKKQRNNSSRIILIHSDIYNFDNKTTFFYFLLIFLLIIAESLVSLYNYFFKNLDFWMFEFLIIFYLFMKKIFKLKIYKHQKIAIFFNSIFPSIFKLISIFFSIFDEGNKGGVDKYKYNKNNCGENKNCNILKDLYAVHKWLIPIGIITYIGLFILRSWIYTELKWFMDIEYASHNKILINYGIFGVILYSVLCLATNSKQCKKGSEERYEINDYICKIHDNDNNTYFASFSKYFEAFKNLPIKEKLIEIFVVNLLGAIAFFISKYSTILIIKNLTPIHYIFSTPFMFFTHKIVLLIYNTFNYLINHYSFFNPYATKMKINIFFFDLSGDLLSLLGFLVYLEIVVLHFCELDYDIKINIMKRSNTDYYNVNVDVNESILEEEIINEEENKELEKIENETKNNENENENEVKDEQN